MKYAISSLLFLLLALSTHGAGIMPGWELPPAQQRKGHFWREHWYNRGAENHNPGYERRLRVNSPETVLHPTFGKRVEARENGLMLIRLEEDLFQVSGAELYLEMWGGHPGTSGKRVSVNGRSTYELPRVGTEQGHCTYSYPAIPLKRTDLVNGWNAIQLALEQGTTFWGHMMLDEACLRVALTNGHPDLLNSGLAKFEGSVSVEQGQESMMLSLDGIANLSERIERVDFQGWYCGYDENGNQRDTDWHGFTRNRIPEAFIGSVSKAPFQVRWDTSMIPSQKNVAVRAFVRFKDAPDLIYVTAAATLVVPERPQIAVAFYYSPDLPTSFWSRANSRKSCSLVLDVDPAQIERAELWIKTWTGGAGTVKDYFTINGRHFPVAEGTKHVPLFGKFLVDPALLKAGTNTIHLLSDTEHHGIEILYPGPALVVRYRR